MWFFFRFLKLIRLNIVHLPLDFRPLYVLECLAPLSRLFFYLLISLSPGSLLTHLGSLRCPCSVLPKHHTGGVNSAKHFVIA